MKTISYADYNAEPALFGNPCASDSRNHKKQTQRAMEMMRPLSAVGVMLAIAGGSGSLSNADEPFAEAASSIGAEVTPKDLLGEWDVSLFYSATAPASKTTMDILSVNEDGTLSGTFYNTEFDTARYTERDGQVAFSILTSDGSGLYATSGRLIASGHVEGQTLAAGRDFIMMWTAKLNPE